MQVDRHLREPVFDSDVGGDGGVVVSIGMEHFQEVGDVSGNAIADAIDGRGGAILQRDQIGGIANGVERFSIV